MCTRLQWQQESVSNDKNEAFEIKFKVFFIAGSISVYVRLQNVMGHCSQGTADDKGRGPQGNVDHVMLQSALTRLSEQNPSLAAPRRLSTTDQVKGTQQRQKGRKMWCRRLETCMLSGACSAFAQEEGCSSNICYRCWDVRENLYDAHIFVFTCH